MKKLFYLLFLITLCFTYNLKTNAEEIDCSTHPYACVKCSYRPDWGQDYITFTIYSDGSDIIPILPENETVGSNYDKIHRNFNKISSSNFRLNEENKLFCPAFLAYSDEPTTDGKNRDYNFDISDKQKKLKLEQELSENNNKNMFENSDDLLSCSYQVSEGSYVTVVTNGFDTFRIESDKYDVSIHQSLKTQIENKNIFTFKDNSGNLLTDDNCPTLHFYCMSPSGGLLEGENMCTVSSDTFYNSKPVEGSSTLTGDDIKKETDFIDGNLYKYLLGSLKMPLSKLYGLPLNFTLQVGSNKNYVFENITANEELCSNTECLNNANYYAEKGLKNIRSYCNDIYESYANSTQDVYIDERMQECISFNSFYSTLVSEGIVNNLADYCGILSEDFVKKLSFVLNIIMIAGPILAILLGTVDFIKVIANGDADKEMKTAFKHFMIRVGSAALLFIVPLLLSFILNIFMANEGGYDPENPFCNVNDWSE